MTFLRALAPSASIPVYKSTFAPKFNDDGTPRVYTLCRATNPPCVLVHPDRWEAFIAMFPPGTAPRDSTPTPTGIAPESAEAFTAWRKDGPNAG